MPTLPRPIARLLARVLCLLALSPALAALARSRFDLLLTDIVMPVLDGIALALKASSEHRDLTILMMTGYAHERQRAHDLDVLVHRVLTKPFTVDQFRTAIRDVLTGSVTQPQAAGWA